MREMKDSGIEWIGEIPKDWKVTSLKRLAKIQTGTSPTKKSGNKNYSDEIGIPWIKAENLNSFKSIRETSEYLTEHGQKLGKIFPAYTVYVCCIASIGKVGYSDIICSCNQQINGLIFNKILNWKFGFYETIAASEEYNARTNISVTPIINSSEQGGIKFVVPSLSEQQSIASFLDSKCADIDALSSDIEKQIETLKEYKKSLITHAVTKGLNSNVEMKDSGIDWIGEIPKHWISTRFKYIASIKSNLVTPKCYEKFPQISPDNIEKNTGKLLSYNTVEEAGVISSNHLFYKGQIIYSKIRPNLNKVTIAPFDGLCSADMYPIESTQHIKYVMYLMLSNYFVEQVSIVIQDRVKMPKINQEELGNLLVVLPPLSEQQSIASFLDSKCADIDAAISGKEQQLETLKEYKKSLIYTYVTGKKEVPEGE